ncbi:MAG TPA: hypothetical protein VMA32_04120 [Streptosporangiaceae bacterium]|nr:hypothetical protein [Streptosporangiaceae bacterium]
MRALGVPWGLPPTAPLRLPVWQAAATGELVGGLGVGVSGEGLTVGRAVIVTVLTGTATVGELELEHAQAIRPVTARAPTRSGFIVFGPFG